MKIYSKNSLFKKTGLIALIIPFWFFMSCDTGDDDDLVLTGNIEGTVTNALSSGSGTPVPNTAVSLSGAKTASLTTGTDGSYRFENLIIGDYTVSFSHPDFEPGESKSLTVRSLETVSGDIALTPIPAITVSQSSLDFGGEKKEISLTFKNVLSVEITYEMEAPNSWISLSKTTGTLGSQNTATILVTVDREKMSLGLNEGAMTINVPGRASTPLVVTALNNPETAIEISPTQLDFGSDQDERTLTLNNTGNSDVTFEISKSADWISLNKSSGTIQGLLQDLVKVTVNRASVTEGDYDGTIVFNIPGSGAITVQVLMTKSPLSSIEVNPNEIDFGTTNLSNEITLKNPNNVTIDYNAVNNTSWISLNKTTGNISANGETKITINIDRSALIVGKYQETVIFNSSNAGSVNLTILAEKLDATSAILQITQTSLVFGEEETSREVAIENIGSASMNWSLDVSDSWLSASKVSGTIAVGSDETIQVFVVRDNLTNGDYDGQLSFSGNGGSAVVNVSMVVNEDGSGNGSGDDDNDGIDNSIDADDDNDGLIEINSIDDLDNIRNDLSANGTGKIGAPETGFTGYEMVRDLDFENQDDYVNNLLKSQFTSGNGWDPIGDGSNGFNAIFEGNGFTIRNLTINRTTNYSALFALTNTLTLIQNLNVEIKFLSGNLYTAGLIGWNRGSVVNCSVSGKISNSGSYCGLLIAVNSTGMVSNCFSEGIVSSEGNNVGGLIGMLGSTNYTGGSIEVLNCYSDVDVSGNQWVGGLIGVLTTRYSGSATISACYSKGNVTATPNNRYASGIGGLISQFNRGTLKNCYSLSNISAQGSFSEFYAGGLLASNSGEIISSFCSGEYLTNSANGYFGGFSGSNSSNGSISATNYWNTETSGLDISSGNAVGQTTSTLQGITSNVSIYATWDPDVWDFGTSSQYPALKNMPNGLEAQGR